MATTTNKEELDAKAPAAGSGETDASGGDAHLIRGVGLGSATTLNMIGMLGGL